MGRVSRRRRSSSGIGLAAAERFLEEGSRVFLCGVDPAEVEAAVAGLAAKGEVSGLACDVSLEADVARLTGVAAAALGGVDVLVNNAGIARRDPPRTTPRSSVAARWSSMAASSP